MLKNLLLTFAIAFVLSTITMCIYNQFVIQETYRFSLTDILSSTFFFDLILIIVSLPGMALSRAKWCTNALLKFIFYFMGLMVYSVFAALQFNDIFGAFFVIMGGTFLLPYGYFYYKTTTDNSSIAI